MVSLILPVFIRTYVLKNAHTEDGKPHNIMDNSTADGMTPDKCALGIINAIKTGKEEVYIAGVKEKGAMYLKRWWPALFSKVIRKANVK